MLFLISNPPLVSVPSIHKEEIARISEVAAYVVRLLRDKCKVKMQANKKHAVIPVLGELLIAGEVTWYTLSITTGLSYVLCSCVSLIIYKV